MRKAMAMIAVATVAMVPTMSPASADPVRPAFVRLPAAHATAAPLRTGTRVGRKIARTNNLLGAPLLLAFMGAVAGTIGTVVVVTDEHPSSPQGG